MKKVVRIGTIEQQDDIRRQDMLRMSSSERISALIEMRDRAFPYEPLKRVACVQRLG